MEILKESLLQMKEQSSNLYDFLYDLFFYMSLKESEEDIKNGKVMTLEESKERMKEIHENFNLE